MYLQVHTACHLVVIVSKATFFFLDVEEATVFAAPLFHLLGVEIPLSLLDPSGNTMMLFDGYWCCGGVANKSNSRVFEMKITSSSMYTRQNVNKRRSCNTNMTSLQWQQIPNPTTIVAGLEGLNAKKITLLEASVHCYKPCSVAPEVRKTHTSARRNTKIKSNSKIDQDATELGMTNNNLQSMDFHSQEGHQLTDYALVNVHCSCVQ